MKRNFFINILLSIALFIDVMFSFAYSTLKLHTATELFVYRILLIILLIFSWTNYFNLKEHKKQKNIFLFISQLIYVAYSIFIIILSIINNLLSYQIIQFCSSFIVVVFSMLHKYFGEKA